MSNAANVTDKTFTELVLQSEQPVLVDFWATWCPPCIKMSPIIDQVSQEIAGKAAVYKLDTDDNQEISAAYNISSIPTLKIYLKGEVVESFVGVTSKKEILAALEKYTV